jgi:Holliday junction DNA helicase RuvA
VITNISGTLLSVEDNAARLEVGPFQYTILIPEFSRRNLQGRVGEEISLHTIQYLEGNPQGRMMPRMIGFERDVEREFFELFCSVDGVGAKKALRAMVKPVSDVAALIEEQDIKGLSALPGIGPATSERIVAKLRRKMPKFALLVTHDRRGSDDRPQNVIEQTVQLLCQLGHSAADARRQLDAAIESGAEVKDVEQLLQLVYQRNREGV